jgi:hypothetical protein
MFSARIATKLDHYPGLAAYLWIFPDFGMSQVFREKLVAGIKFCFEEAMKVMESS